MDSVYWKEWKLFKLPGKLTGFLAAHIPLFSFFMYGLIEVYEGKGTGLIFSLLLSISGLFAYTVHTYFMRKGKEEFNTMTSKIILNSILIISTLELAYTLIQFAN